MNTDQHTVTIPIADYNELLESQKDSGIKFNAMRENLIKDLEGFKRGLDQTRFDFIDQIIRVVKAQK